MHKLNEQLDRSGFAIVEGLLEATGRAQLETVFTDIGPGTRDGLRHPEIRHLATAPAQRTLIAEALGPRAFAIRATLFDKTPQVNWAVPWHQDTTIPVRQRCQTTGFVAWSMKSGQHYVRPPAAVLESMLALRLDLDGSDTDSGALRVIPGSHRRGILSAALIDELTASQPAIHCLVPPGGALIMHPLLLHSSARAHLPRHRRIVHLEFAATTLPGGLLWQHRVLINGTTTPG